MSLKTTSSIVNRFMLRWVFIPVLIVLIFISLMRSFYKLHQFKNNQLFYLNNMNEQIQLYLDRCIKDCTTAMEYISDEYSEFKKINKISSTIFSFHSLYLLNKDFRVIKSVPYNVLPCDFSEIIGAKSIKNSYFITGCYKSSYLNKLVFTLVYPEKNGNFFAAEICADEFEKFIKLLTPYIPNGSIFLADSNWQPVLKKDNFFLKNKIIPDKILHMKNKSFTPDIFITSSGLKLMSAQITAFENWRIIIEQDVLKLLKYVFLSFLICLLITFSIFFTLLYLFNKKLYNLIILPVTNLSEEIDAFAFSAEQDKVIDLKHFKTGKPFELEELQNKFVRMQKLIKKREKELQQSFEIVENSDYIAILKDTSLRYLRVNKAFFKLTGIKSISQIIGKTDFEIFKDSIDKKLLDKVYAKEMEALSLEKGKYITTEDFFIDVENKKRFFLTKKIPVYDDDTLTGIATLASEITTIKEAKQQLQESEEKYRCVVEDSPLMICTFLPDGKITFVNRAYCDYFNKKIYEMVGTNFLYFLPEYERMPLIDGLKKLTLEDPMHISEHRVILKNGEIRWQRWTDRALFNKSGRIYSYQAIGEDITERKKDQERLAAEKERLSVTLKSIGDGVITTDIKGRIILLNNAAEGLTGWSQKEAEGRLLSEVFNIIDQESRKPYKNPVQKVLTDGKIIEFEKDIILIDKKGREKIIADSGAPIKDRENNTIGVVIVFRDMTEKKKMQNTLQITAKLESLGILAGGIAHDFNNLLGGIFGYIDLAIQVSSEEKVVGFLTKSMNAIERAKNLTGQLLTFSKGGSPAKKTDSLFPFIKETAEFILSGSKITCSFEIAKDLMPCNFDKNQIGQAIDNIVINAKQAMSDNGNIHIKAENVEFDFDSYSHKGQFVKISIHDSGIGMPEELLGKVFDPFFTTKEKGHGIGLTTTYSIIEKHNGFMEVESKEGEGTTFYIYLPAAKGFKKESGLIEDKIHHGKGTILVMDDEDIILKMISEILESFGYETMKAQNGEEALKIFKKEKDSGANLKAVICDLTIPGGMGGKETVKEIRKIDNEIAVFVASGYSDDPVINNPFKYGFTASISKPFKISELSVLLNKHII